MCHRLQQEEEELSLEANTAEETFSAEKALFSRGEVPKGLQKGGESVFHINSSGCAKASKPSGCSHGNGSPSWFVPSNQVPGVQVWAVES